MEFITENDSENELFPNNFVSSDQCLFKPNFVDKKQRELRKRRILKKIDQKEKDRQERNKLRRRKYIQIKKQEKNEDKNKTKLGYKRYRSESEKKREEKEQELNDIKNYYLGVRKKEKKKEYKPKENCKDFFMFSWKNSEDTSRNSRPVYSSKKEVSLLFGRGNLGGIDPETIKEESQNYKKMCDDFKSSK